MQEMFEQLHEDTERVQLPNDDATLSGEHEPDYDTAIAQTPHASSGNDGEGPVDASPGKQSELSRMERELGMVQAATRELMNKSLFRTTGAETWVDRWHPVRGVFRNWMPKQVVLKLRQCPHQIS